MTNKNYLVSFENEQYVVRMPGEATEKLINRNNEETNSKLTSTLGINVKTIYFNSESGLKISLFHPKAIAFCHKSIKNISAIKLIAKKIKKLHNSDIQFNNTFNIFEEYKHYFSLLKDKKSFLLYTPYTDIAVKTFHKYQEYFQNNARKFVPCHNDLVPENILDDEGYIYIIDWEYSGMNDPLFDIASFFLESRISHSEQEVFLKEYFGETASLDIIKKEISYYQFCQDILWSLWTFVKEENNEDFGDYKVRRLKRAIEHLRHQKIIS